MMAVNMSDSSTTRRKRDLEEFVSVNVTNFLEIVSTNYEVQTHKH